jgi:phosphate transport system protein
MLAENKKRMKEVREKTVTILEGMLTSQKLVLRALEDCDNQSAASLKAPLKGIGKKVEEIDHLILTILARYTPEARDLREMVAFIKITSSLLRIATNEKNYIKNMDICNPHTTGYQGVDHRFTPHKQVYGQGDRIYDRDGQGDGRSGTAQRACR